MIILLIRWIVFTLQKYLKVAATLQYGLRNMKDLKNVFSLEKECEYKGELYSVRDNGAVRRHPREGKRLRKDDDVWTFLKLTQCLVHTQFFLNSDTQSFLLNIKS